MKQMQANDNVLRQSCV